MWLCSRLDYFQCLRKSPTVQAITTMYTPARNPPLSLTRLSDSSAWRASSSISIFRSFSKLSSSASLLPSCNMRRTRNVRECDHGNQSYLTHFYQSKIQHVCVCVSSFLIPKQRDMVFCVVTGVCAHFRDAGTGHGIHILNTPLRIDYRACQPALRTQPP